MKTKNRYFFIKNPFADMFFKNNLEESIIKGEKKSNGCHLFFYSITKINQSCYSAADMIEIKNNFH